MNARTTGYFLRSHHFDQLTDGAAQGETIGALIGGVGQGAVTDRFDAGIGAHGTAFT